MTQVLKNLVSLLSLEAIEEDLYRGSSQDLGFRQLFGGQVLGQCVSAASRTVEASRHVHSMHGYFLRPGDASLRFSTTRMVSIISCRCPMCRGRRTSSRKPSWRG